MKSNRMKPNMQWPLIVVGIILLTCVLLFSADPHLLTSQNPYHREYANYTTGQSAPFPPSRVHPLGTDQWGRDFLARTLAGTWNTLFPAVVITCLVLVASLLLAALSVASNQKWLSSAVSSVGAVMAPIPVLLLLILAMNQRNMASPYQALQYVLWISAFEVGRSSYLFQRSIEVWMQMDFVESAVVVGRSRLGILFTHLRSWLLRYALEFGFSEFARLLSLMAMLATFHVYPVEHMSSIPFFISYPPVKGVQSAQISWTALIGDSTNNFAFISYPYFLYGPVLALLTVVIGANLVARGIRGGAPE